MLTYKKKYCGRARNKSGGKNKNRGGQSPLCHPAGDAPDRKCIGPTLNLPKSATKFIELQAVDKYHGYTSTLGRLYLLFHQKF